jgi:uncharacterized membrane protein YfcA
VTLLVFTVLLACGSAVAGMVGALTGLGGGVIVVPLLTLVLGVDIRYAIGASLVSVIATSSGAAAAYLRDGYVNLRVGLFLEIATTLGALAGGALAVWLSPQYVATMFGVVLAGSALVSLREPAPVAAPAADRLASRLRLSGRLPLAAGGHAYAVRGVPGGFALMFAAGVASSLLGIGSGAIKVLALDRVMGLPFKVSTTTSNFMIGVTAAAGAGVYLNRGYIDPALAMPVMLGVLAGSFLGARLLARAPAARLRIVFAVVLCLLAAQMIYDGLAGRHV